MVEKALNNYLATLQDTFSKAKDATELTYRLTLETLLKQVGKAHNITHEPKRHKGGLGAPDFMIQQSGMILGYVEAKDVGVNLDHVLKSDQIKKYQQLTANLLITNNLEWIWIHKGHITRETLCYQTDLQSRKFKPNPDKIAAVSKMLEGFFSTPPKGINRAKELAQELSIRTRNLRDHLAEELQRQSREDQQGRLHGLYQIFQKTISSQLSVEEFSDAFAQTLSYGLFLAKLNAGSNIPVTLSNAKDHIANNFELIRELVSFLDELKNDSYIDTRWLVEEILGLLNGLDLLAIQEDLSFSKKQGRLFPASEEEQLLFAKDPYVYFYEDFLKAYDKETRKSRGIYYTPPPVVNFIIRAIQDILKKTFGITAGLADHQKVTLLDFATGTGTFLIEVLQQIFEDTPPAKHSLLIKDHILKNIYGFEYLIAPYTIAHLKLSQFLHDKGYVMHPKERLQIYLANTLESPDETIQKDWLVPALTKEAEQARDIKRKKKILVITGNPPYSVRSRNTGTWITDLLKQAYYKVDNKKLDEQNPKNLLDDYVKFIRFAQWKMDQVDEGVVGIITNHSFLDNPTFRGMRQSLLKSFNQIYILDLHGNSKKKEKSPDGSKDENVFDIEQGVSINLFIKNKNKAKGIYYANLWGKRHHKYQQLLEMNLEKTPWQETTPSSPFYFFIPQNNQLREIYDRGWKITDIFQLTSTGIKTHKDQLTIQFSWDEVEKIIKDFSSLDPEIAREKYQLGPDSRDWQVKLAQADLLNSNLDKNKIIPIAYRPFDVRYTYYTGKPGGFHTRPRQEIMSHMLIAENNIGLVFPRITKNTDFDYGFIVDTVIDVAVGGRNTGSETYYAPLYLTTKLVNDRLEIKNQFSLLNLEQSSQSSSITENINPAFPKALTSLYQKHYSPEQILGYIYAILHSPTYRQKYKEFLKSDFPRIPLVETTHQFEELSTLGWQLVQAHLLRDIPKISLPLRITCPTKNYTVEKPLYQADQQRLYINKSFYMEQVPPAVWNFHIGGYQVLDKYLKSRLGRELGLDDINHIEKVIKVLDFTIQQMQKIDAIVEL